MCSPAPGKGGGESFALEFRHSATAQETVLLGQPPAGVEGNPRYSCDVLRVFGVAALCDAVMSQSVPAWRWRSGLACRLWPP